MMFLHIGRKQKDDRIERQIILSKPDFRLNFLQIALSADQFSAGILPFETSDQLHMLRADYSATHVIQRRENKIVCIPFAYDAPLLGEPDNINVSNAPYLVCKLMREAILRLLEDWGFTFTDFDPPSFISRSPNSDMLARAVGTANAARVKQEHVYPRYSFVPRVLFPFTGPPYSVLSAILAAQ